MSHDLLDDLLADVPRHVVADPDRAWRAGTARRRRRHAAEGLAIAAAVALVGLGLVQLRDHTPVQPAQPRGVVDGYPREVGWPVGSPALPARPGPMAGALEWSTETAYGWSLVDASGRSWVLPQLDGDETFQPTLSDDGRWLGYLRADDDGGSTFVLRDLVTDEQQEFPEIGSNRGDDAEPFLVFPQSPSYWSPDNSTLLVTSGRRDARRSEELMLSVGRAPVELRSTGHPVGWQDDDHIVWMRSDGMVRVTDRAGEVVKSFTLPSGGWPYDQWSARVSPDGTRLAVFDESTPGRGLSVLSLSDGHVDQRSQPDIGSLMSAPVWQDDRVLLWDGRGLVDASTSDRVVSLSGHWPQATFAAWAPQALAGPEHGRIGLLEWRYWPVWWWWKQLLGGAAALIVVLGIWWFERRDRKTLRRAT